MVNESLPALLRGPLFAFEFGVEKLGYFDPIFFIFGIGCNFQVLVLLDYTLLYLLGPFGPWEHFEDFII